MAISTIGTDALASAAVTSAKLASGAPSRSQLPAGTVLQVVNATYSTEVASSSTTYADTGLSATITPTAASSKIFVVINHATCGKSAASANNRLMMRLLRDTTQLSIFGNGLFYTGTAIINRGSVGYSYIDSPATTSAVTYKTQFANGDAVAEVYVQVNNTVATITLMEIAA